MDHAAGATRLPSARGVVGLPVLHRRPLVVAGVALAAVWGVAILFRALHLPPGRLDLAWDALMSAVDVRVLHTGAQALAVIGTGLPAAGLALLVAVVLGVRHGWAWGLLVVVASVLSEFDVLGLKTLAGRIRPDTAFGIANSFPSGHTANAALLGTVVVLLVRHLAVRIPVIAYVIAMALSRTLLHAHWLTDVVGGLVVGAAAGVLLVAAFRALLARETRSRAAPPGSGGVRLMTGSIR